jgi:hypothetical protein
MSVITWLVSHVLSHDVLHVCYHMTGITFCYHVSGITYLLSHICYHMSGITCLVSHVWFHISVITCVLPYIWYHISVITCPLPHVFTDVLQQYSENHNLSRGLFCFWLWRRVAAVRIRDVSKWPGAFLRLEGLAVPKIVLLADQNPHQNACETPNSPQNCTTNEPSGKLVTNVQFAISQAATILTSVILYF